MQRLGFVTAALAVMTIAAAARLDLGPPWSAAHAQTASAPAAGPAAGPACRPHPYQGRDLYLRGTHNSWNADERFRFTWFCNRFELVAPLQGEHQFKVGDEGWSRDADFGGPAASATGSRGPDFTGGRPVPLVAVGTGLTQRFAGTHRFILSPPAMSTSATSDPNAAPTLSITACDPQPLGERTVFLRGTMNNWGALDDYALQFSCDAYYLNVKLEGRHDFKIGDSTWAAATTFGARAGSSAQVAASQTEALQSGTGVGNLNFVFSGEQTLRLAFPGGRPSLTIGPKSFADPTAKPVTDPVALSLVFDSRSLEHKSPFGAVTAGTPVDFKVHSAAAVERLELVIERRRLEGNQDVLEYTEVARVPMRRESAATGVRWKASHRFADVAVYGYHFEAVIGGKAYVLHNNREAIHWTREKGANGRAAVDEKPASPRTIRRFRHTVYAADFRVPDWAQDVVYYYIFPERYRNGDRRNDPRPGRDTYQDKPIEKHARWNEPPFRPGSGDGSDHVFNNDFFGGDLAGIIDKLDDIRDLGANTIYMTPVFKAPSNHKYDTADYRHIDPAFGTDADFERLTREAARRGIRVIPDTSLNHVGSDSVYFDRFSKYQSKGAFEGARIQADSPYASWFSFDASKTNPEQQFKGWVGINDLPELNKASPAFRRFAYGDRDSVMKLWLDRGAAGWRMDVAPWVPDDFWREWRSAIKAHKPDALTVAETWFDASKFFLGDMFDSTMNYIFRNAVIDYGAGGSAADLVRQLEYLREVYPPPAHSALMNLTSSHDAARVLHTYGYHDDKTPPERIAEAKRRQLLTVFLQMTHPGAPTVYYGDEVGVTGGEDPYNRATYPWADQGGKPDLALREEFKKLIAMRNRHAVLRRGELLAPLHVQGKVAVFGRRLGETWAVTAVNSGSQAADVEVKLPGAPSAWADALSGATHQAVDGRLKLTLPPISGLAMVSR